MDSIFTLEIVRLIQSISFSDGLILLTNLLLFIFAGQILKVFSKYDEGSSHFAYAKRVIRVLNLIVFALIAIRYVYPESKEAEQIQTWDLKILSIIFVIYIAYLINNVCYFFIQQKFGKERDVNGEKKTIETYNTRLISLLVSLFITVIALISAIRILGFDSWLEAGGVIGFIGVFLALTQSSWAPDIFSGLIILNSDIIEEGDVIEIVGSDKILGIVFKTKMFHTEILNLVNNHRVMIRNANLRDYVVHNLSRFASAKGLREQLHFKLSYETSHTKFRELLEDVQSGISENKSLSIEHQHPFEIGTIDAGDFAVEWVVYYYTKDVKNILQNRLKLREEIISEANNRDLSLATPMLNEIRNQTSEKPRETTVKEDPLK